MNAQSAVKGWKKRLGTNYISPPKNGKTETSRRVKFPQTAKSCHRNVTSSPLSSLRGVNMGSSGLKSRREIGKTAF